MPAYDWDFSVIVQYRGVLIQAFWMTVRLFTLTLLLAMLMGFVIALLRQSRFVAVRAVVILWIEVVRSIPPLVIVVWFYYCLPIVSGISFDSFTTCVISLSIYTSVFFAEIVRAGLQSIDRGQVEAALSVGMTSGQVLRRITGPLAFLRMVPPFTSQCVLTIKATVLASYVAVGEMLYEAQRLSVHTFRPMEFLTIVAIFFIVTILPLTMFSGYLERKYNNKYFNNQK